MKTMMWAALALLTATATPALAQSITDGSFETPAVGTGYIYNPTVAGVTFNAGSGVQGNGSDWHFANAPDGMQTAFIQSGSNFTGAISFDLTGLTVGKTYNVDFFASARPDYANNTFGVSAGEAVLGIYTVTQNSWQAYSSSFVATGTTANLSFAGSPTTTGDNDVGLDNVRVTAVPEPATWAMMVFGFAMVGFGLRARRKITTKVTFA